MSKKVKTNPSAQDDMPTRQDMPLGLVMAGDPNALLAQKKHPNLACVLLEKTEGAEAVAQETADQDLAIMLDWHQLDFEALQAALQSKAYKPGDAALLSFKTFHEVIRHGSQTLVELLFENLDLAIMVQSRHEGMEAAEKGVSLIVFSLPDTAEADALKQLQSLSGWWIEMMEIPCALDLRAHDSLPTLSEARADFWLVEAEQISSHDLISA